MTSVFSWHNSVSLRPASFCTPRSNLPVTPAGLPNPGIEPESPALQMDSLPTELSGKPIPEQTLQLLGRDLQCTMG